MREARNHRQTASGDQGAHRRLGSAKHGATLMREHLFPSLIFLVAASEDCSSPEICHRCHQHKHVETLPKRGKVIGTIAKLRNFTPDFSGYL
jgi:hypothetical protein